MLTILTHSYLVYRVVYYRLCVCAVNDVINYLCISSLSRLLSLSKNTHFFLPTKFWIKKSISKSSLVEHPPKASSLSVCGVVFWRRVKEEEEKKMRCCSSSSAFESSSSSFRRSSASTKNVLNNARSHRRQSKMMMMMAMHSSKSSAAASSNSEDGRRRSVEEVVVSEEYRGEMMMSLEALKPSSSSLLSECSSNNTRRCAKNEFVQISKVSKAPNKAALEEDLSKLQLFGRKYWPALATLEFLALIGASLNGVLSRKRRLEIERLNIQMRAIMQRAEDERFEAKKTDGGSTSQAMGLIGKAKSTYASGEYDAAIALFQDALDAVKTASASGDDDENVVVEDSLSARKGLAMAYQASGDLTRAAAQLERALLIAKDSTVFGMLGDVYTDMGELAKAGDMYDKCLDAME